MGLYRHATVKTHYVLFIAYQLFDQFCGLNGRLTIAIRPDLVSPFLGDWTPPPR